jgi:hypothetical protein
MYNRQGEEVEEGKKKRENHGPHGQARTFRFKSLLLSGASPWWSVVKFLNFFDFCDFAVKILRFE